MHWLKENVSLSKRGWRQVLPQRRALNWLQVCWRSSTSRSADLLNKQDQSLSTFLTRCKWKNVLNAMGCHVNLPVFPWSFFFLSQSQLSPVQTCSREELQTKWKGLCLPVEQLESLLSLGSFSTEIDWMEFFALGCGALGTVRCSIWSDINPNNTSSSKGQTQLENLVLHLFCSPKVQTRARHFSVGFSRLLRE